MRAGCTIAAKEEWALARVTAASFAEHHPGVPFFALLADEPEGCFDPAEEPFEVIPLSALEVPRQMLFRYERQALSYALTPSLIELLLDRGFSQVMFVKQESLVLGELPFDALGSIALTPHLLEPIGAEEELPILLAGAYNGGLVGVADRPQGHAFLAWWAERLREHCVREPARGLHFEQHWLDLVPAYFGETVLIRDPGCNIGHWNAHQRGVAGASLVRFSGYSVDEPELVSRYRDLRVDDLGPFAEVWRDYHRRLVSAGTVGGSYAYDRFDNGAHIPPVARQMPLWGDPFGDEFFRWLAEGDPVPRMWELVRERRPDLRRGFAGDDEGFLAWVATHGAEEYGSLG